MIITAGYNVGGPEVEDALLKHPAVAEVRRGGKPDAERGQIVAPLWCSKSGQRKRPMVRAARVVKATIAPLQIPAPD